MSPEPINGERIRETGELADEVEEFLKSKASTVKTLEVIVLILSVLTAGSLWLLLSNALPKSTLWFGAIASTATTFIALYMGNSGMVRTRNQALALLSDIELFMGVLRANGYLSHEEYFGNYKPLRNRFHRLKYGDAN